MNKEILNKPRIVIFILLVVVVFGLWFFSRPDVGNIRNVILISIDTCRADHLGCYGYQQKTTPNIDAIAAEGILFESVVAPTPLTLPSHASMLTGTIPVYHGVHDNGDYRLGQSNVSLAEILKEAGFVTGAAVSAFVLDSKSGIGQGFDSFDDRFDGILEGYTAEERRGDETTRSALDWLEENKNKPFFYFLHYYDPHMNYQPPEPFASRFTGNPYAGEIAFTDHCIGRVMAKLKELDLYDSTLVIITSDHGEMLGEHGEFSHGYFIYQSATKVPLIFKAPGRTNAVRIKQRVGLIDIVPTVCSLLGIEPPAAVQGVDLSTCFGGGELLAKQDMYCESLLPTMYKANSLLGIVTDRFKYIQTTRPELYDLVNDPAESINLIDQQSHRARILRDKLTRIIQLSVRDDPADSKVGLDEETRRRLESLGYVGSSVVEDFDFDQTKEDPKDVLDFHLLNAQFIDMFTQDKYDKAKGLAGEMVRARPEFAFGYQGAGQVALKQEDYTLAISYLQKAIELDPGDAKSHTVLGMAFQSLGKLDEAVRCYTRVIEIGSGFSEVHYNLGQAFVSLGKFEQAIEHYQQVLQLKSDNPETHYKLGVALMELDKFEQAIEHYRQSLQLKPDYAEAHNNLGVALFNQNKIAKAIVQWKEALRSRPNFVDAANNLAWSLATVADGKLRDSAEAVRLGKQVCELTQYSRPRFLDTLAVAYAATGDFPKAIETAEKALPLASRSETLTHEIQERIELYKANKPYYDK
jgi:arylsulfatase A-like enzyme/Flp pilus assembly protein TadD